MSLIRKHGAVLQAWACLDLVLGGGWVFDVLGLNPGFVKWPNLMGSGVSMGFPVNRKSTR